MRLRAGGAEGSGKGGVWYREGYGGFTLVYQGGGVGLGCAGAPPGCVHGPVAVWVTQAGCKVRWFLAQAEAGTGDRAAAAQSCGGREGGGIRAPINQGTGGGLVAPGLGGDNPGAPRASLGHGGQTVHPYLSCATLGFRGPFHFG